MPPQNNSLQRDLSHFVLLAAGGGIGGTFASTMLAFQDPDRQQRLNEAGGVNIWPLDEVGKGIAYGVGATYLALTAAGENPSLYAAAAAFTFLYGAHIKRELRGIATNQNGWTERSQAEQPSGRTR